MLRANRNRFAKIRSGKSVIDRQNETATYFAGYTRDPIALRLIQGPIIRRIHKNESFAINSDQFVAQIHRHRIEELVGNMNARERIELVERFSPLHSIAKFVERLRLALLQSWKRLNNQIARSAVEFGKLSLQQFENVARKFAVVGALFDDPKSFGLSHLLPNL